VSGEEEIAIILKYTSHFLENPLSSFMRCGINSVPAEQDEIEGTFREP